MKYINNKPLFYFKRDKENIKNYINKDGHFTAMNNGIMDLLHLGHIYSLHWAKNYKKRQNYVIVGLNSDSSAKKIKRTPIFDQEIRAKMLLFLDCVDCVVIFDEDTPKKLIEFIKPMVLVKGGNYKKNQVIGKEIVESYGGEVVVTKYLGGYSTTKIIEKIKKL